VRSRARGLWRNLLASDRRPLHAFLRSLEARFGPLDVLTFEYARLASDAWWTAVQASEAALTQTAKRRHGRGRRPTLQELDRRMKRQGLAVGTFDQLVRRVEELAGRKRDLTTALRERLR
jgi:hypothetical protein